MTGLVKIMKNFAPPIMCNMFIPGKNNFNQRNFQEFATERKRLSNVGLETVSYRCAQLWTLALDTIKAHLHN